ncbi:CHRD domain-containing protein [Oculatella sp. LEGE 06141]|uniref:CHRD domain-containing protein n=1 Tax=Oculatella sp. LEGE 06141 TaxID=1828648 RepID=UPI00187F2290|nr:CHRD domain-containing protein [Oculatella sp. LEGE 06141]MBE9177798.1 CHRD domain-containing protein [Oculatella sp. LEGE 06141]
MSPSTDPNHTHDAPGQGTTPFPVALGTSFVPLFASLTGTQEVPSNTSTARGFSSLALNTAGDALSYSLTVSGLDFGRVLGTTPFTSDTSDDVTLIHIHDGDRGVNGPVALSLFQAGAANQDADDFKIVRNADNSVTLSGIWEQTDASTLPLSNFANEIRGAKQDVGLYWNVHTTRNPGGEVRGQLQPSKPVNLSASLTGTQEVPPNTSRATGSSSLALNAAGDALRYSLTVSGVDFGRVLGTTPFTPDTSDDVTLIHIHDGDRGVNGPVALSLFQAGAANQDADDFKIVRNADNSVTLSGIWEQTDASTLPLSNFVGEIQSATPNQDVGLYWNVHTTRNPGGEVRGQLQISQQQGGAKDAITGTKGNDRLVGTGGRDVMKGLAGNDVIRGLGGNDVIDGGIGKDRIDGGLGRNTLTGKGGADVFVLRKGNGLNIVTDFKGNDRMALTNGLQFGSLTISQQGRNTLIRDGQDQLARLIGVRANTITASDFV